MAKGKPIPKKTWAALRAEFESGEYSGIDDFYKRHVEVQKKSKKGMFPTLESLRKEAKLKGWKRKGNEAAIEEEERRLTVEMLAKQGLPPVRAAQALVDGVLQAERTEAKMLDLMKEMMGESGFTQERLTALIDLCRHRVSDLRAAAVYLDQYHKITGQYAPTKHQHTGRVGITDESYSEMSIEQRQKEIEKRLERVKKLRVALDEKS